MAITSICLFTDDGAPSVDVLTLDNGESFLSVTVSGALSVSLPGRDHESIDYARALAAELTTAADALAAKLPPKVETPSEAVEDEVLL